LKEAQPTVDAGAHVVEPAQAVRASAATGGDAKSTSAPASLAPDEADRYAMAFRPSWEPVAGDPASVASLRSLVPSVAPRTSTNPPAPLAQDANSTVQEELQRLRGKSSRSRSVALAAVSVLSFAALVYWGISSTTSGTEESASRSLNARLGGESADTLEEEAAATPIAAEPTPSAPRAPEPTGLTARLADPDAPAVAAQGDTEAQPEAAEGAAATAEKAAAASGNEQAAATAEPAAAAGDTPAQPASAAPEAQPAPQEANAAPAQPAQPVATTAPPVVAKPAAPVAAAPPQPAPSAPPPVAAAPQLAAQPPAATKPAVEPQRPAAAPAPATATKAAEPAVAKPPQLVVRAVPDQAQLWLDGQRMSNPFDTRLPLGSKHKIEAKQEGYETSSQTIRLEADARLTITLRRDTPAPAPHLKVHPLPEGAHGACFVTSNPY
jgi:hypothetical protein